MWKKLLKHWFGIGRAFFKAFEWVFNGLKKLFVYGVMAFIPLAILWATIGFITDKLERRDDDPYRGAAATVNDPIDPDVKKENIAYLEQNWEASDSLWFYKESQGSNLLPYAFFLHLEQPSKTELFRANEHMNALRYLPQDSTSSNPDALPVGMAFDSYKGKEYMGFTCAACHTSQINYLDGEVAKALRIDGGPAAADMEGFLNRLALSLEKTLSQPEKLARFVDNVVGENGYSSKQEVQKDLAYYAVRIRNYSQMNAPVNAAGGQTHYGFARLDAFGRIYNRVLQHVIDAKSLRGLLAVSLPAEVWRQSASEIDAILNGDKQTDLLIRCMVVAEKYRRSVTANDWSQGIARLRDALFNYANAPASYPYLWDIAQHDFVQWTGLVANAGVGSLGRNVGQVIGVFGTLDWEEKSKFSLRSLLGLRLESKSYIDFESSIDKRNLSRVEQHLRKLQSPGWPSQFPKLNESRKRAGQKIFEQRCASCHANIDPRDPARRIVADISAVELVGTDPVMANNATRYSGRSGLLKGKYVDTSVGNMLIEETQPVASLVKYSSRQVVAATDADTGPVVGRIEWAWDLLKTLGNNEIKPTIRRGNFNPATTADPFAPVRSYKARALNGIWATAPYLHNGSVPNLYELLLPKRRLGDPEFDAQGNRLEYRRDEFYVGSRQFDPKNVGFKSVEQPNAFKFNTDLPGNSNAGHEYAAGITANGAGQVFTPLSKEQRYQLVEYLKSL